LSERLCQRTLELTENESVAAQDVKASSVMAYSLV
jgi:hypothetical protein